MRIRAKISGSAVKPRLAVFRSNRRMLAQLIDDAAGKTVVFASSAELAPAEMKKPKTVQAELVGKLLATRAREKTITVAVFDRRRYRYHGRVKALADGARSEGLKF